MNTPSRLLTALLIGAIIAIFAVVSQRPPLCEWNAGKPPAYQCSSLVSAGR